MTKSYRYVRLLSAAAAALALAVPLATQAVVIQNDFNDGSGDLANISYGAAQDGMIFQLNALLYPGLGLTTQQAQLRTFTLTDLKFGFTASGDGTGLLDLRYTLTNTGVDARDDLRFMVVLGADANPDTFQESVAESWKPAVAGDPTRRETILYDPALSLNNKWIASNGATGPEGSGVPAACGLLNGCDAFVGLQWDLASLKPGETWSIHVGLSDDGQALSSRFFTLTADPTGGVNNSMTFSGQAMVVPEASSYLMMLAGLGLLGVVARRRRSS